MDSRTKKPKDGRDPSEFDEKLISERKKLRQLEVAGMEISLQPEKSKRQKAEKEVKDLKPGALAAKSSVKHDQEWDA
jgi:hypothetical protein